MSGKGIKKTKPAAKFSEKDALAKIDMSQVTAEGVLKLVQQIGELKRENAQLKEDALKPHIPSQMTVEAYNWCVDVLIEHFNSFGKAKNLPGKIDVAAPKIIAQA